MKGLSKLMLKNPYFTIFCIKFMFQLQYTLLNLMKKLYIPHSVTGKFLKS